MSDTELSANAQLAIKNLVRMALSYERARRPLKKEDIRELILKSSASESQKEIFNAAQVELRNIFGCELVELPLKKRMLHHKRTTKKSTVSSGKYILRNTILSAVKQNNPAVFQDDDEKFNGVVAVVLSLIFLSSGSLALDSLLNRIEQLGLPKLDIFKHYPEQEEVRNLGIELVSQMVKLDYLVRNDLASIPNGGSALRSGTGAGAGAGTPAAASSFGLGFGMGSDGAIDTNVEYSWGPRAYTEYSSVDIAKFIANLTDSLYDNSFIDKIVKSSEIDASEFLQVEPSFSSDNNVNGYRHNNDSDSGLAQTEQTSQT